MSDHHVCITLDFDSISLWVAMGQRGPTALSRGEFGAVAAERLLDLFARFELRTTWFIPGMTIDTYPALCERIAAAGHEIGHHGYRHIAPASLSRDEERRELERGIEAIRRVSGVAPRGYRSPAWELSPHSVDLLVEYGFVYDSSMMGHDYLPYPARRGDVVHDDRGMVFGPPTGLMELPIAWSADDFPHFEYFRGNGLRSAAAVAENWLEDFMYLKESLPWGVMTYTLHPFVIGRGHRLRMLERLIVALSEAGASFLTAEEAVARCRDHID